MVQIGSIRWAAILQVSMLAGAIALGAGHTAFAADSAAVLRLKPSRHDFGKVVVTQTSAPLIVTVTNKSRSVPITFTSIVAAETFSIQSDKCSGSPLAAGHSCKLEVVFRPLVTGKITAQKGLTFTDSAQNGTQQLELDGQGIVGSFL